MYSGLVHSLKFSPILLPLPAVCLWWGAQRHRQAEIRCHPQRCELLWCGTALGSCAALRGQDWCHRYCLPQPPQMDAAPYCFFCLALQCCWGLEALGQTGRVSALLSALNHPGESHHCSSAGQPHSHNPGDVPILGSLSLLGWVCLVMLPS